MVSNRWNVIALLTHKKDGCRIDAFVLSQPMLAIARHDIQRRLPKVTGSIIAHAAGDWPTATPSEPSMPPESAQQRNAMRGRNDTCRPHANRRGALYGHSVTTMASAAVLRYRIIVAATVAAPLLRPRPCNRVAV